MADVRPSSAGYADGLADTVGSMPPTLELLSYYRKRIEEFESERAEFLKRFRAVEVGGPFCAAIGLISIISPYAGNWK